MQLSKEVKSQEGSGSEVKKNFRRKSGGKSRLLKKAKKFAKQGRLGRGYEIDTETYNYFLRVLEIWQKNEFDSEEEKGAFFQNSLSQTVGNEINYSSNQMTSRVLETILPESSEDVLCRFANAFGESLRTICTDSFASHVLEKLLEISSSDKWLKNSPKLAEWFRQTCRFVLNNVEEFTFDPYANHVMRKVCQCLTGYVQETGNLNKKKVDLANSYAQGQNAVQQQNLPKSKPTSTLFGERTPSKKNQQIFADFYQRFLAWPQFYDLFQAELTCGLVQTVLKTCVRVEPSILQEGVETGVKKVVEALGDNIDLANTTHANLYTRTLEVCLGVVENDIKTWLLIYSKFFKNKLAKFGAHEKGKFCLKKVIETCPTKENFEEIFDEIYPSFPSFYKVESPSFLLSICLGCKTFQTRQSQFFHGITSMIEDKEGANENENFVLRMVRLGLKLELKEDGKPKYLTDHLGTMISQALLEFHKPTKMTTAMLEMDLEALGNLCTDPKGSHVIQSFFNSATVSEKSKDKMLNKLKELMVALSINKFGSRVIDALWAWGSMKQKAVIASALCERVAQLNANRFGKFISEKCALESYKRHPKLWAESLGKDEKMKKAAEEILSELNDQGAIEDGHGKKKKKKNKRKEEEIDTKWVTNEMEVGESSEPQKKKHKKKKEKSLLESDDVSTSLPEHSEDSNNSSKKKKKKRKHLAEESIQEPDSTTNIEEDMPPLEDDTEIKKKKKRKRSE